MAKITDDTITEKSLLWGLNIDSSTNPLNISSSKTGAKTMAVTIA
jgi:hypothetical protein